MGFLRDSAERYKVLREQVTLAETEVNDQLTAFEREMRELAQQGTDPTIGPENNVEDIIDATQVEAQLAAPPSPSPSEVLRQQMEADRLERLRRAGLGDTGPVAGPSRLLPSSPLAAPAPIRAAPPRRSVAFGAFEPSNITAPPGWDHYESASQAPRGDRIPVTSTAPPHQFVLQPRRSLAPGASAHPRLSTVPEHELDGSNELAYTMGMIDQMVGEEPTSSPPAYLKVTKMTLPKPYLGKDDLDAFEMWLHNLLEFFRTLRITGPSMDPDRLRILGDCLSDEAAVWMYNTVQSPSRERRDWLFEEAVIGLFRRFIHCDTHLQAAYNYNNLCFEANKGGVAALYERLLSITEKMWEKPTQFQLRNKFLNMLPMSYVHTLTVVNGLSVKYNSLAALYQAVLELEQSSRELHQRRRPRDNATSVNPVVAPTDHRVAKAAPSGQRKSVHTDPAPRTTSSNVRRAAPVRTGAPRPDRPRPTTGQPLRPAAKPAANKAASQCFSCGQVGHFASDPTCPNHGKKPGQGQRMFAQRVLDDMSDGEHATTPNDNAQVTSDHEALVEVPGPDQEVQEGTEVVQDLPQSDYEFVGSQYESEDEVAQPEWEDFQLLL
ncbi:uncharacterized protein TRAVEDRAFT_43091 [Trametes versicolor FP-101664 SS1]|uniref:uncharacterized protein n=1 Tax=Trametes versicolor (strain FP-101664) TaxID=717944 RepID=UPI0004622C1A|nr:uncharacterized protein TRAVEDRAFT_43091 [Trametes versicolor FP-101664 SS1]EIW62763.1 hypothetical protein TRAVEDRAFT_43091 [Trametes versicolor FP-101664 SS1]